MSTIEALGKLNEGYVRAAESADVAWYQEHLADDFVISTADGALSDKAEFLRRIGRGPVGSAYAAVEPRIRVMGDVALIHAGFRYAKPDGSQGTGRYTDIWALREGRWLCISAHFNRF